MQPDSPHPGHSHTLTCNCGFYTTLADYMLTHVAEGNCMPSESQLQLVMQKLNLIDNEQRLLRNRLNNLEAESTKLNRILVYARNVLPPRRQQKNCRQCGKLTYDKFGGTALCAHHVSRGGQRDINNILEELIYGPDITPNGN